MCAAKCAERRRSAERRNGGERFADAATNECIRSAFFLQFIKIPSSRRRPRSSLPFPGSQRLEIGSSIATLDENGAEETGQGCEKSEEIYKSTVVTCTGSRSALVMGNVDDLTAAADDATHAQLQTERGAAER